jgi:hypothetical protein
MEVCSVAMPSYTYTVKAQKLLKLHKFKSEIRRSQNTSGCGYSLFIYGDCCGAAEILDLNSVPYLYFTDGGA